jgi:hypothetical protein
MTMAKKPKPTKKPRPGYAEPEKAKAKAKKAAPKKPPAATVTPPPAPEPVAPPTEPEDVSGTITRFGRTWVNGKLVKAGHPVEVPDAERARDGDGQFVGDDPETPDKNEAWEGGVGPTEAG